MLVLAGCAKDAPVVLSYGTLTENHGASGVSGCTELREVLQGDVALSASLPGVSRRVVAGQGATRFDFAVEPTVTDGGATLTLTAIAHVEATHCGTRCPGSSAEARFSWRGAVLLPSPRGYDVRISFDASRETDLAPSRFSGECQIETPWRTPVVVETGRQWREVVAPPGMATIAVTCRPVPSLPFVGVACLGAPIEGAPSLSNNPSTVDARLTVRFTFTPKAA